MKKIIFTLLIGFLSVAFVNGQTDQGTKYIGGNMSLGFGSSKFKVGGTTTDGPKTFNFGLNPAVGYFIADNFMVGLGIGFDLESIKEKDGSDESKSTTSAFNIGPFVRYYIMPTEKLGFFVNAGVGVGFGKIKNEITYDGTTVSNDKKLFGLGINVTPGIVIHITEKVAFEGTFGGLVFNSSSVKWTENDVDYKNNASGFALDVNPSAFTFGLGFHIF